MKNKNITFFLKKFYKTKNTNKKWNMYLAFKIKSYMILLVLRFANQRVVVKI